MTTKKSIKYNRLVKKLASGKSTNLKQTAIESGYTESSASSHIYTIRPKITKDLAEMGYSKEACQAEFKRILDKCEANNDYSNVLRSLEAISKIAGHYNDKSTQQTAIFNLTPADSDRLRSKLNDSKELGQGKVDKPI